MRRFAQSALITIAAASTLSACGGGGLAGLTPGIGGGTPTPAPTIRPMNAPQFGKPTFAGGGTGDCTLGITFTSANQTATIAVSEAGYSGAWAVSNATPTAASVSIAGTTLTVTSLTAGQTYFTVSDSYSNSSGCNVGVTTTGGTIH